MAKWSSEERCGSASRTIVGAVADGEVERDELVRLLVVELAGEQGLDTGDIETPHHAQCDLSDLTHVLGNAGAVRFGEGIEFQLQTEPVPRELSVELHGATLHAPHSTVVGRVVRNAGDVGLHEDANAELVRPDGRKHLVEPARPGIHDAVGEELRNHATRSLPSEGGLILHGSEGERCVLPPITRVDDDVLLRSAEEVLDLCRELLVGEHAQPARDPSLGRAQPEWDIVSPFKRNAPMRAPPMRW